MDYEAERARYKEILLMREAGKTLREIGERFGVCRGRIWQILQKPPDWDYFERCRQRVEQRLEKIMNRRVLHPAFNGQPGWRRKGREKTRFLVRLRDNFTCQTCGKKMKEGGRSFDVHHLDGLCGKLTLKYDKIEDMPNLITLCHKCHYNHPEHTYQLRKSIRRNN